MIKSMTGFGQARGGDSICHWNIEIRSWNHRFFECSIRVPASLNGFEEKIRDVVHRHAKRGKVAIAVSFKNSSKEDKPILDEKKIDFFVRSFRNIQKKYGLKDSLSANALFSVPSLFISGPSNEWTDARWNIFSRSVDEAAKKLDQSKVKEGDALAQDLRKRVKLIEKELAKIQVAAKKIPAERVENLKTRISELVKDVSIEPKRFDQEIVFLAERIDITEEVVRANHHLSTFEQALSQAGEIGKKLDFITQEMNREVNTISSKAQSTLISDCVVRIKTELEKIREQIQNVE